MSAFPPTPTPVLPGYECQLSSDAVAHSSQKLDSTLLDFSHVPPSRLQKLPSTLSETLAYRCTCGFQIIDSSQLPPPSFPPKSDPNSSTHNLVYCMRNNFTPVSLLTDRFPIANNLIQKTMESLIIALREVFKVDKEHAAVGNLTSCKFVSSWDEREIFVTFSYSDTISNSSEWLNFFRPLLPLHNITSLTARFQKQSLSLGREIKKINDRIVIKGTEIIYEKPEDAFCHPNRETMEKALEWLCDKIGSVKNGRILEMYCGSGAHTIALARCVEIEKILCVEIDQRLVDYCNSNIVKNNVQDKVKCVKGDAGKISSRLMRRRMKGGVENSTSPLDFVERFNCLLVDPPRSGLDGSVKKLAMSGEFEDMFYVSCGRSALVEDLKVLCEVFEVESLCVTDLFPRTDSVETLVHLKKKKKE